MQPRIIIAAPRQRWHSRRMQLSRYSILFLCTAVATITSIGMSTFSLFLPPIEKEFGLSRSMVTLPYMVAMLGWAAGALTFGKLADDRGSRLVVLIGIALMGTGFAGMGVSQNLWQLSLSYGVCVGMAMGACSLVIMSLLVSKHFASNRGLAVAVIQTAPPMSPLLFAPIIYFLIRSYDWRTAALLVSALLFLIAWPLAWIGARDPEGSLLSRSARVGWSACLPYLRTRSMRLLFAVRFSCGVAFFQIAHLVALTMSKGFDAATGAKAVSVFGAGAVVSALLFGWLSDRYGRPRILGLSYLTRGVGTLLMALDISNAYVYYAVVALAIGPTFGTVAVGNVLFYELVGPRMAGMVLGMSFIVHQIGSAAGPMLASITYDRTGSYDGFLVVMSLVLLASGLALFLERNKDAVTVGVKSVATPT
ncbi:MAG TPA: MFS transporter [Candidatus Binatia bacterium]|nr:MFS transporter [Candidatus Binatia bacterium]